MTSRQKRIVVVLAIVIAATRLLAWSRSLAEWDEALFVLGVQDYDVSQHHPHPPGYPLFVALAKVVHLAGVPEFEALQIVVVAGAMALFPLLFFLALEIGFGVTTSICGAAVFAFLPNVWVFGGTGFSDIPGLALGLAAVAMLLRGRRSRAAFFAGAVLLALSAAVRPTNLLLGLVPALWATRIRARDSLALVAATILTGALLLGGSYAGAALASDSPAKYVEAVKNQAKWVRSVDSWRSPIREPLGKAAKRFFLWPVQQQALMGGLSFFAIVAVIGAVRGRRGEVLITLLIFLPLAVFSWLELDIGAVSRYSIAYLPMHALLAADGVGMLARRRALIQTAVCGAIVIVVAVWTWPALKIRRTTDSPVAAALNWAARHAPPASPLHVFGGIGPQSDVLLRGRRVVFFGDALMSVMDDAWIVDLKKTDDGLNFSWPKKSALWKIVRQRNFEASVKRVHVATFGTGWSYAEIGGHDAWRWMGGESETILPPLHQPGRLALRMSFPGELLRPTPHVEVLLDGELLERFEAVDRDVTKIWIVKPTPNPVRLVIRTDVTASPGGADTRQLGMRLGGLSWTALR